MHFYLYLLGIIVILDFIGFPSEIITKGTVVSFSFGILIIDGVRVCDENFFIMFITIKSKIFLL